MHAHSRSANAAAHFNNRHTKEFIVKIRWALIAILSATVGCHSMHAKHHEEDEEDEQNEVKMSIDQVPPAVRATIMEAAAGATVGSVDKEENSKGMFTYETDVKSSDGKNWEIRVSPDGKLISKKIDMEDEKPNNKKEKDEDDEKEEKGEHK